MSETFWTALIVAALTSVVPPVVVWLVQRRKNNADAIATYATATSTGAKTIADLIDEINGLRAEMVQERADRAAQVADLNTRIDKKQTRITHIEEREAHTEHQLITLRATFRGWASDVVTAWNVVSGQLRENGLEPNAKLPPLPNFDN